MSHNNNEDTKRYVRIKLHYKYICSIVERKNKSVGSLLQWYKHNNNNHNRLTIGTKQKLYTRRYYGSVESGATMMLFCVYSRLLSIYCIIYLCVFVCIADIL